MVTSVRLKPIFLDHNSTTELEQGALETLLFFSSKIFGNASSIHWAGRKAKTAVEDAREKLAQAFGAEDPDAFVFTSGATESINTVLKGLFFAPSREGREFHLITSQVEHEATLETAHFLERLGAKLHVLPVRVSGELNLDDLRNILRDVSQSKDNFVCVSLMAANNETGVVFPVREAALLAKEFGAYFHVDAVQAPGKLAGFSLREIDPDFASFSGHKIGGPKGVGALYVKRGKKIEPFFHGGAQERKRRAGTINVPAIASFGAAAEALAKRDIPQIASLRSELEALVKARITGTRINGEGAVRIANTANFSFEGAVGEGLIVGLDLEGFAVSSGSACSSGSILPSHVLLAMGLDKHSAASAVRVSLGPENTMEEITAFVDALERVVSRVRAQSARSS